MLPVPHSCLIKLDINSVVNEYSKTHISKELAFCRRERDKIFKQAEKTYFRVINKVNEQLVKNSCNFKVLEQAYIEYCIGFSSIYLLLFTSTMISSHPQAGNNRKWLSQLCPTFDYRHFYLQFKNNLGVISHNVTWVYMQAISSLGQPGLGVGPALNITIL